MKDATQNDYNDWGTGSGTLITVTRLAAKFR
jgi:hypothetical protein